MSHTYKMDLMLCEEDYNIRIRVSIDVDATIWHYRPFSCCKIILPSAPILGFVSDQLNAISSPVFSWAYVTFSYISINVMPSESELNGSLQGRS